MGSSDILASLLVVFGRNKITVGTEETMGSSDILASLLVVFGRNKIMVSLHSCPDST
jgi:hypothetical protein